MVPAATIPVMSRAEESTTAVSTAPRPTAPTSSRAVCATAVSTLEASSLAS